MDHIEYCEGCPNLLKVIAPCREPSYNWKCMHKNANEMGINGKIIAYRMPFRSDVQSPSWCPLLNASSRENGTIPPPAKKRKLDNWDIERILKKLPNNLDFDSIEEGDVLHVPPIQGLMRATVVVKKKYITSLTCEVIESDYAYTSTIHLYDDGLRFKFATKVKSAHDAKQ